MRVAPVSQLQDSPWIKGPLYILEGNKKCEKEHFPLENENLDKKPRPSIISLKGTLVNKAFSESKRF